MVRFSGRRRLALLFLPLVVLLAGCVKVEASFTVSSTDSVDASILLAVEDTYASAIKSACSSSASGTVPGGTVTPYKENGFTGCTMTGKNLSLSSLSKSSTGSVLTHANGGYTFEFKPGTIGASSSSLKPETFTSFKFTVTFPGEVTSHNGSSTVSGTTVTWTKAADLLSAEGLKATAKEGNAGLPGIPSAAGAGSFLMGLIPWAIGGVVLLVALVVILLVVRGSKKSKASAPNTGAMPGQPGPGAYAGGYPPQQAYAPQQPPAPQQPYPPSGGQYPQAGTNQGPGSGQPPTQQYPTQQYPAQPTTQQPGQYPPQPGQYPPQPGQYPPAGQQYPPQQPGQYPPPGQ
ncbi:MAG: hypothetical protein WAV45_11185 [Propionibacteriaceae bacterium]|nr:hypothetical protein [Micropruina sp.]HBX80433.1 hypothetical protein [Propionibacteriaceae bacterium]HBY23607.1 hypothetical protein [Propionibacteriaceae bacterium]